MIKVKVSEKFKPLYNLSADINIVVCIGGRGGMKTYEVSKFIAYSATIKVKRCVILRDELTRIKESILNEIWDRYDTANVTGYLDQYYSKNDTELKDKKGNTLVYTKGFRASNNQKTAFMKGDSDIDLAVIEEAEDIREEEKFNTFADSLRKKGSVILIMLNTPDIGHWICKRYFNTKMIEDGYYELIPKKIPGFVCIQTNYTDNPYLPDHIISNYKGYGDPKHHLYNYNYYMTAICGYASTGRKGQIFTKVKPISRKDFNALPYRMVYGQDFGTASPAAFAGVKFYQNNAYMDCLNYKPMTILGLAKLYVTLGLNHSTDKIVCDYAEPDSILQLQTGFKQQPVDDYQKYKGLAQGWYAVPCPTKDIEGGISLMNSMNLWLVEDCTEAWTEVNNYVYAQDKYKNYTDTPIDDYNHFLDAVRYVISEERGNKGVKFS